MLVTFCVAVLMVFLRETCAALSSVCVCVNALHIRKCCDNVRYYIELPAAVAERERAQLFYICCDLLPINLHVYYEPARDE